MKKATFSLVVILSLCSSQLMSQDNQNHSVFYNPCEIYNTSIIMNEKVEIINLGPNVNSPGYDYAPTVTLDGKMILFCSNRSGSIQLQDYSGNSHDFWVIKKEHRLDSVYNKSINLKEYGLKTINTYFNEGAASISADGGSLYYTSCNRNNGFGSCDIFHTHLYNGQWSYPGPIQTDINTELFDSQPSIGPYKDKLFFVSSRRGPNSNGEQLVNNFDIWYSEWDSLKNDWKPAQNLEGVNTRKQESAPYIASDGVTLFFSSDGHSPNYGGLDLYVTKYDIKTKKWSKPVNLGEPINSSDNEQFISIPAAGDVLYFSSDRDDIDNHQGEMDIYMCTLKDYITDDNCGESEKNLSYCFLDKNSGKFLIELTLDAPGDVQVGVYDVYGKMIEELENAQLDAGTYLLQWDGKKQNLRNIPNGLYFYHIDYKNAANHYTETKKIMLLN